MSAPAARQPIAATDRVSDVLARDESLVEVFARAAPQFTRLRNRAMRRVMARLVTVEQAARMAGVRTDALLHDLNSALGIALGSGSGTSASSPAMPSGDHASGTPLAVARRPRGATDVALDVREDLRAGREPFSKIMAAVGVLAPYDVLHLRTTFEPIPLYAVLEKRGFAHESQSHEIDDWSVWFWRSAQGDGAACPAPRGDQRAPERPLGIAEKVGSDPNTVWLDVRDMEPPEPLVRTLAALELLPDDYTLVQVNVRVPQLLLPMLAERGYAYDIDASHSAYVVVRIWRTR